jgi:transcriptional regulator with XRE-family HTH domain
MLTMGRKSQLNLPPLDLGQESIGQRLARIRKERGFTQVALAKKIGIIQGLITDYERDKLRLHAEMLARFAQALDVSTDEILGLKPNGHQPAQPPIRLWRRLQHIQDLPPKKQKILLETIDTFIQATAAGHG